MKYWISFAFFQISESISDISLIFILPFYYELKLFVLLWLVHGTKLVYDSIINRELTKREKAIDKWLIKINKYRNELIALLWFELSRCSVKIISALMSSGLSVLTKSQPDLMITQVNESCNESSQDINMSNSNHNKILHHNISICDTPAIASVDATNTDDIITTTASKPNSNCNRNYRNNKYKYYYVEEVEDDAAMDNEDTN